MRIRWLCTTTAFCALHVTGLRALQNPPPACDQYQDLLRANPNNLDAAARLGRCSFRDYEMVAPGGDSTKLMFRSSWSTALRALRHAVALDPSFSGAYRPLFSMLFAETRDGCSSVTGECRYVSPVLRAGDSLLTIPRVVRPNGFPDTYEQVVGESQASRRQNLSEARDLARRWAAVAPNDPRPHQYLGQALLRLDDAAAAAPELEQAGALGTPESRREMFWDRMEALLKTDNGSEARRVLDEEVADPGRDTTRLARYALAGLNALLGRNRPPAVDSVAMQRSRAHFDSLMRNRPRSTTPSSSPGFATLLGAGDTTGARQALARTDSMLASGREIMRMLNVGERTFESAQLHLAIRDTAGAIARLDEIERTLDGRWLRFAARTFGPRPWVANAWLLRGDLAAARGRRGDAARMYRRVIGLWEGGDSEVQPLVEKARTKLGALR